MRPSQPSVSRQLSWPLPLQASQRLNQLGTPVSIRNGSALLFAWPGREFHLWSDFGTVLIQTPNFSYTEPNACTCTFNLIVNVFSTKVLIGTLY